MKCFVGVIALAILSLAFCVRPASGCPMATGAVAVENASVAVVAPPVVETPVVALSAPAVVQAAPVLTTIAVPAVSVVAVPTVIEQIVKVKVRSNRHFRTPVRSLLFR